ncbi:hypothetical protein CMQ_7310 [Grosmannia clavigera kw1407]|uniref:Guanine nucleotide-exchange factor SEC12 n=1 Tax=Grosmannia clavigera (strain kw1407 / UAMH 11150) TaxID=655863 RepID=F0XPR8_GROCL|nr:uncharacterized protein CMQ_7310 [Grosmannia clavigera kw1407]EFX00308.1 hypothetical protein CMQ_7310 [Grosmannia clavigera kw1407]
MDIRTSKAQLTYPLYACDFDAQDAGRLVVGGGGGSSRTGVGNCITVLDSSSASNSSLATVAEIELSKDEDNVTSLAAGPRFGQTTLAFAGVNSSPADQKKGKNEHFRVFSIDTNVPAAAAEDANTPGNITELAHASFFAPLPAEHANLPDDTYQRLVRLSAPFSDGHGSTLPQLGACATGLARAGTSQIVLFDVAPAASGSTPSSALPHVRCRIEQLPKEATDLDVVQTDVDRYQLAFCNEHELFLYDVAAKDGGSEKPVLAYTIPLDVASGATERPVFRALRYVTPQFVLVALNMPRRTGVRLMGLRLPNSLPASAPVSERSGKAKPVNIARTTTVHIAVPRSILTQATALTVRGLTQPATPGGRLGDAQFVVAVAGAPDNTIALYTLEQQVVGSVEALAKLYPFRTLRQVHELQMTSLALSPFVPPSAPTASATSSPSAFIRLASVSVKNTVVVHHIPLRTLPGTAAPSRYVVALKSRGPSGMSLYIFMAVVIVLIGVVSQSLLEIRGAAPVASLLRGDVAHDDDVAPPVLFLRGEDADHTIEVVTHSEAEHGPAVAWDGLTPAQQSAWRQRLQDAGHWGQDMGETVFRGVLFSELAGVVGEMVR